MASFTDVLDTVSLSVPRRGEEFDVALSGTYAMDIALQRETAPGSGSWQTVKHYTTANATVAERFASLQAGDKWRLIVVVDTSGTCTATLTAVAGEELSSFVDPSGNVYARLYEGPTFDPVKTPVVLTADGLLNKAQHANRPLILSAVAGFTVDLPAATGSGDVYEFYVGTTLTSNNYIIDGFDTAVALLQGVICGVDDEAEFTWGSEVGADNRISLGGTAHATGGQIGDYIRCVDIATGVYHASGFIHHGTGTEANPFSTAS